MRDYRRYRVWAKSYELALEVYRITIRFPSDERYGITSQLRRAAVSIPSNFAEGIGRKTDQDKARFVRMSMGSANELEVQLELSRDLGYLDTQCCANTTRKVQEVRRMLTSFARKLDEG